MHVIDLVLYTSTERWKTLALLCLCLCVGNILIWAHVLLSGHSVYPGNVYRPTSQLNTHSLPTSVQDYVYDALMSMKESTKATEITDSSRKDVNLNTLFSDGLDLDLFLTRMRGIDLADEVPQLITDSEALNQSSPRDYKKVDCAGVFLDNDLAVTSAINRAEKMAANRQVISRKMVAKLSQMSKNCSSFLKDYGFITRDLSNEEREFPIAFSIIAYKTPEMVIRLLRSIYR